MRLKSTKDSVESNDPATEYNVDVIGARSSAVGGKRLTPRATAGPSVSLAGTQPGSSSMSGSMLPAIPRPSKEAQSSRWFTKIANQNAKTKDTKTLVTNSVSYSEFSQRSNEGVS